MDTKLSFFFKKQNTELAFISVPTPVLMDREKIISPNRTNYFPISQLVLASCVKTRFASESIPWNVCLKDYKRIDNETKVYDELTEYGKVAYGGASLTKLMVGDGITRIRQELAETDIICITANFTFEANIACKAISTIRQVNRQALIIVGGRDASARFSHYLQSGADIVAIGDADISLPRWFSRLYHGKEPLALLEDACLKSNDHIHLDQLPRIDFDLLCGKAACYKESGGGAFFNSVLHKGNMAYLETSRGCNRECNFCTERLTRRYEMSLERFQTEVEWYKSNGIATLMFSEDNLLQRVVKGSESQLDLQRMFNYLKKRQMIWEFSVGIEIGRLFRNDGSGIRETLLRTMFWNNDNIEDFQGVFRALIPFENILSASQDKNHSLSKMHSIEENYAVLRRLLETGIPQINLAIIIGFPNEDRLSLDNIHRAMDDILELQESVNRHSSRRIKTHINFSVFCATPFPGTPFYKEMSDENRIKFDIAADPELWNLYTSVLQGDTYAPHEISHRRVQILRNTDSIHENGKVRIHPTHIDCSCQSSDYCQV